MSQSKSLDTQFFNSFSMVIGLLVAFAIVLFAYARYVGEDTQLKYVREEPLHLKDVNANTAPFARIAIAGHDNSALAAVAAPAAAAAALPATGEAAFTQVCSACHSSGALGAPKVGDKAAWAPRLAQGKDALYKSVIGGKGNMQPRAGTQWPDATIRMAVDYLVSLNK